LLTGISTGAFGSGYFYLENLNLTFPDFEEMKNNFQIPNMAPDNATKVYRLLNKKVAYEERVFAVLTNDAQKNAVLQERTKDLNRMNCIYEMFFDYLKKKDFCNADSLDIDPLKIQKYNPDIIMHPHYENYCQQLDFVDKRLKDLDIGNLRRKALVEKRNGNHQGSLRFFDEALGKFDPWLFALPDHNTPENTFLRYKIKREKNKIYAQRWTTAIDHARDVFLSPGFFFSTQSRGKGELAAELYKSIFKELINNTDQFSPLLAGKESHIPFFFYMSDDNRRLGRWIGTVSNHPQSFGLTPEFGSLSQQALAYTAILEIVYKAAKAEEPEIIQYSLNKAHQQAPNLLKYFQKNWGQSIEEIVKNMKETLEKAIDEGKKEGQKALEEGKFEESWDIYDRLIDQLIASQTQRRSFEIQNIETLIQDIKKQRWYSFIRNGALMIVDSQENSSKSPVDQNVITIFNNILKEYETFPEKEKDDIYNGYVLTMFPYILFFCETGNYELIKKWIDCVLKICKNMDSSMWTQSDMESIIFTHTLFSKIHNNERAQKIQELCDQAWIRGQEKNLEKHLKTFSEKVAERLFSIDNFFFSW
jgi:hypothetical protein